MHKLNLIIDGNYMLNKLVFPLFKEKRLYGDLHHELKYTLKNHINKYKFNAIDFVCDSAQKSWRKDVYPEYKAHRVKDEDINWEFVNAVYDEFISELKENNRLTVYRRNKIEGDDYMSALIRKYNKMGISCLVMTNDRDICQFVENKDGEYINILYNDQGTREKVFVPKTFNSYIKKTSVSTNTDYVFDLTESTTYDDTNLSHFLSEFVFERDKVEVDSNDVFLEKLLCGDTSDNIKSVAVYNNRGIKEKGFEKFYTGFVNKYSVPIVHDNIENNKLLFKDIANELVIFKKIPSELVDEYRELFFNRLLINFKIIYLKKLPDEIEEVINLDINKRKSIF